MFWFFGPKACGILAPPPGIKPIPPALEDEALTTGLPGKSLGSLTFLASFPFPHVPLYSPCCPDSGPHHLSTGLLQ